MTIEEFLAKYGTAGLSLAVSEFIKRAPSFTSDKQIAGVIGTMMGDLESAFDDYLTNTEMRITKDKTSITPVGFDIIAGGPGGCK